ncbi:hypothetical protein EPI11_15765 [Flavobacterium cerinum]|uniref:Uncharacterized protein n=1 Tax=Flavobacterium cerinum TaxID=2502784 RepID=A0A444GN52_9FLAO|nr:hypothetical protein EPI11_15765 [Flavobacterium cerinum]
MLPLKIYNINVNEDYLMFISYGIIT